MACHKHKFDLNKCTHGWSNLVFNRHEVNERGFINSSSSKMLKPEMIAKKLLKRKNKIDFQEFYNYKEDVDTSKCVDLGFAKLSIVTHPDESLSFNQEFFKPIENDINDDITYSQLGSCLNIEDIKIKLPTYIPPIQYSRYYSKKPI